MINGAVDDFIEDKKMWFRDLYHKHGDYTEKDHKVVYAKNAHQIREVELEDHENREEVEAEIR